MERHVQQPRALLTSPNIRIHDGYFHDGVNHIADAISIREGDVACPLAFTDPVSLTIERIVCVPCAKRRPIATEILWYRSFYAIFFLIYYSFYLFALLLILHPYSLPLVTSCHVCSLLPPSGVRRTDIGTIEPQGLPEICPTHEELQKLGSTRTVVREGVEQRDLTGTHMHMATCSMRIVLTSLPSHAN